MSFLAPHPGDATARRHILTRYNRELHKINRRTKAANRLMQSMNVFYFWQTTRNTDKKNSLNTDWSSMQISQLLAIHTK